MQRLFDKQQPGQPDHPRHEHRPRSHHLSPENVQGDKTSSCKWVKHASGPAASSSLSSSWSARDKQQKHVQKAIKHYQTLKQEAHLGSHCLRRLCHLQGGKCQVTRNTKQLGLSPWPLPLWHLAEAAAPIEGSAASQINCMQTNHRCKHATSIDKSITAAKMPNECCQATQSPWSSRFRRLSSS